MAINFGNANKENKTTQKESVQDNVARERREETERTFDNLMAKTSNVFGGVGTALTNIEQIAKAAQEYIDAKTKGKNFKAIATAVDHSTIPSVVISAEFQQDGLTSVIAHTLMIYPLDSKPEPVVLWRERDEMIDSHDVWADAIAEPDYIAWLEENYSKAHGIPLGEFSYASAGSTAIDSSSPIINDMVDGKLRVSDKFVRIMHNILTELYSAVQIQINDPSTYLTPEALPANHVISATFSMQPTTTLLANELPVAEDFLISLHDQEENPDRNSRKERRAIFKRDGSGETSRSEILNVSSRISLGYWEPDDYRRREDEDDDYRRASATAAFIPEIIMVNIDMLSRQPSLSLLLQAVSATGMLAAPPAGGSDPLYLEMFRGENAVDCAPRNLGALMPFLVGRDGEPLGKRMVLRPNATDNEFFKVVDAAIRPSVRVGIEIPSQGPLTTLTTFFQHAAVYAADPRDVAGKSANDFIIEAANYLTNNYFSEYFDGDAVMLAEQHVIPGGYWVDENGQLRDTREIDFLYLANQADPDAAFELADAWLATFSAEENSDQVVAAHKRFKILERVKSFVHTDNHTRVYFHPEFIMALNEALLACGLGIVNPTRSTNGRGQRRRVVNARESAVSVNQLRGQYRSRGSRRGGGSHRGQRGADWFGRRR